MIFNSFLDIKIKVKGDTEDKRVKVSLRGITKTKTPIIFLSFLLIFVAGFALVIPQASATTVSIGNFSSAHGETITAPILISEVENYGTGGISVTYNPAVVNVTSVSDGPDSSVVVWTANNTAGIAAISAWNLYGVSGDVVFANISFTAVGSPGSSTPLNLNVTTLADIDYDDILAAVNNGSFSILSQSSLFDTGTSEKPYPSIFGTHNGTIKSDQTITVNRLYTYACPGTGGHAEFVRIWGGNGVDAHATWVGYVDDWHNLTFDESFTLESGVEYNYTIRTGSYPQIIHASDYNATGGKITCTEFVDANGLIHENRIPAIRLFYVQ